MFFDRGTFWVLPLAYFYLPKSAGAYLFLQSVKNSYFCSGPISVDPICPQPTEVTTALAVSTPGWWANIVGVMVPLTFLIVLYLQSERTLSEEEAK